MDHEALCYTLHCRGTEYRVRKWAPGPEWLLSYLDQPKLTIPIQMATRTFIATAFQSPIHLTESRGWVTPLQGSLCMPYTTNFQVLNILDTLKSFNYMQITVLWQYTDMYNPNPSMNKLNNVFSAFPVSLPASGLSWLC